MRSAERISRQVISGGVPCDASEPAIRLHQLGWSRPIEAIKDQLSPPRDPRNISQIDISD
jgi:hypothetical protein